MMIVHIDGVLTDKEFIALSSLFGEEVASDLKEFYANTPPADRDKFIDDMMKQELEKIIGLGETEREEILVNIETLASVCGGEESEIINKLKIISGLLNIEREITIKPWSAK